MKRIFAIACLVLFYSILSLCALPGFCAGEITATEATGQTLYAVEYLGSQVMTASSGALGTESDASWSTYAIPLTEIGTTGTYVGSQPTGAAANKFVVIVYEEATPGSVSLANDTKVAQGSLEWTGTAPATLVSVQAQTAPAQQQANTIVALNTAAPGSPTTGSPYALLASNNTGIAALSARADAAALLTSLLNTGHTAFTAAALAGAPTGTGGGAGTSLTGPQIAAAVWDEPTANHTTSGTFGPFLSGLPSANLAVFKADPAFSKLLDHILEKYTYVPGTHTLTVKGDDGATLGSVTVTVDTFGNITSRQ